MKLIPELSLDSAAALKMIENIDRMIPLVNTEEKGRLEKAKAAVVDRFVKGLFIDEQ